MRKDAWLKSLEYQQNNRAGLGMYVLDTFNEDIAEELAKHDRELLIDFRNKLKDVLEDKLVLVDSLLAENLTIEYNDKEYDKEEMYYELYTLIKSAGELIHEKLEDKEIESIFNHIWEDIITDMFRDGGHVVLVSTVDTLISTYVLEAIGLR